jgi:hypothetical protein
MESPILKVTFEVRAILKFIGPCTVRLLFVGISLVGVTVFEYDFDFWHYEIISEVVQSFKLPLFVPLPSRELLRV